MRIWPSLTVAVLILAPAALAADKDVVMLQREMAILEDRLQSLQSGMNQRYDGLSAKLEKTLVGLTELRAATTAIESGLQERMAREHKEVAQPVASLHASVEQVNSRVFDTGNALAEVGTQVNRIGDRLTEIERLVRSIQMPPPPPPSASEANGGPPAGVTPEKLFQTALDDQASGRYSQASQEFSDYLRYFDYTELIAGARYHLGEIALIQGNPAAALSSFDLVIERYPKSVRTPDALYQKAKALAKLGKRSAARQTLRQVIRSYPNTDAASNAQADLRGASS